LKQSLELHLDNPDFKNGVLAIVDIDLSKISGKTTKMSMEEARKVSSAWHKRLSGRSFSDSAKLLQQEDKNHD
jgi:hypothetical protein